MKRKRKKNSKRKRGLKNLATFKPAMQLKSFVLQELDRSTRRQRGHGAWFVDVHSASEGAFSCPTRAKKSKSNDDGADC
jgi:hypothetical protein